MLTRAFPAARIAALENRKFLRRAVTMLTREAGVRQFLDIGAGLPTSPNVHEVAQAVAPSPCCWSRSCTSSPTTWTRTASSAATSRPCRRAATW